MQVDLSFIIPVYNLEDYICATLSSMVDGYESLHSRYELVVVDDGSKDSSAKVVSEFASQHANCNIRIIRQRNKGVSAARNKGLSQATGRFVWFFDGDDLLADNSLYSVFEEIDKYAETDINFIKVGFADADGSNICNRTQSSSMTDGCEMMDEAFGDHTLFLWSRTFLTDNDCSYPVNITNNEDWLFLFNSLSMSYGVNRGGGKIPYKLLYCATARGFSLQSKSQSGSQKPYFV